MIFFLSENRLKADLLHDNVSGEYIRPAMITAHTVYLKETLGDRLYKALENYVVAEANNEEMPEQYKTLLDDYIVIYLEFLVMAEITMNTSFKFRNLGIVTTTDTNANQVPLEDVKYYQNYYRSKSEFYENRLVKYLKRNTDLFPEYMVCGDGCDKENVTEPKNSTYGGLYLGGEVYKIYKRKNKK